VHIAPAQEPGEAVRPKFALKHFQRAPIEFFVRHASRSAAFAKYSSTRSVVQVATPQPKKSVSSVRLSDDLAAGIERAVAERGYESASAFMRHAIQKELRHDEHAVAEVEERIAATLNRHAKELRSVHTAQLATFD